MNTLAQQQQALLAALFDWPDEDAKKNIASYADNDWARGLKVYQANGHAMARSALRAAYPVMLQLLGQESFDALACALWHAQPPRRGDLALWGDTLPDFVRNSAQLASEPYLGDVAALEWALHAAASAADASVDAAGLVLLGAHDPAELHLDLAPGCCALQSRWPVVSMVKANLSAEPDLALLRERLRSGLAEDALVWRCGLRPQVRLALTGERVFVRALQSGLSLGQALHRSPDLDVASWLPMAVQTGLLLGVRRVLESSATDDDQG